MRRRQENEHVPSLLSSLVTKGEKERDEIEGEKMERERRVGNKQATVSVRVYSGYLCSVYFIEFGFLV